MCHHTKKCTNQNNGFMYAFSSCAKILIFITELPIYEIKAYRLRDPQR